MATGRAAIRMSDEDVRSFLRGSTRIVLVTNGPDGLPHPMPMNYGVDDHGRILVTSSARSQKVRNLERDPRAALLVESGERYEELKAVIAYCDAEIVTGPELIAFGLQRLRVEGHLAEDASAEAEAKAAAGLAKRVLLRFTPRRIISWDHGNLG
jgi:PPOX class probable F420-dependent enzyme